MKGLNVYYICDFNEGRAIVKTTGEGWNYIDTKCEMLSVQNFHFCGRFFEGYALVKLNGKWNWIDEKGNIVSEEWWDEYGGWDFRHGYSWVRIKGKGYNHIVQKGKLLSDQWWDDCGNFYDGYAKVELNGKCNHIDLKGNLLSEIWWDYCSPFREGSAYVKLNGKFNHIDTKGVLVGKWV